MKRKAVAPVIATLLLVAIAVVGGSIIFVFSQGFFSSAQIESNMDQDILECDDIRVWKTVRVLCEQNKIIIENQERLIKLLENP